MKTSDLHLGSHYFPDHTSFRLYAPTSQKVILHIYESDRELMPFRTLNLEQTEKGIWEGVLQGDWHNHYYTFQTLIDGELQQEAVDPYAKAVDSMGQKGLIVDLTQTNPLGWEQDNKPELPHPTDAIIYEIHVTDFSISESSGIQNKGSFLGFTEHGTVSPDNEVTGIDHLQDLGITHVHLLPIFDYCGSEEGVSNKGYYNWGYNPRNYNALANCYSTHPYDPLETIKEFKTLVLELHKTGIRVIMDVVYNHTGQTQNSNFHQIVPNFYHRQWDNGEFANGSGCGNEIASEKEIVRQYILDSVLHWVREYHIDGFRFDLMGLHDIDTMNLIEKSLHEIDPSLLIYGEGWRGGDSPLNQEIAAVKFNGPRLPGIGLFSDDMRDGIKGHIFHQESRGFISGATDKDETIKFGIAGATLHHQINYNQVPYSQAPWALSPQQAINYASCHDNHTLWDRLLLSMEEEDRTERVKMQKLANAIVLTSQGIPFLHGGVELCRTKQGVENSYNSGEYINQIDWSRKAFYKDVYLYHKGLIAIRKAHPAFRLTTTEQIQKHLIFLSPPHAGVIGYLLKNHAGGDSANTILVYFNGQPESKQVYIPEGNWTIVVDQDRAENTGLGTLSEGKHVIPGRSALVCISS
ncbi:type I pullulanase [Spirochaeta cellobiosiphila]|uniref:type I pullulanase n=1 Tax=Spirochaeta cellobiosiphila TaxID=504483 RepID=UPI0003F94276|nr:type I pullulanase [Spirochaeta cellobiosiphila]